MDYARRGEEALNTKDFPRAIEHYTLALKDSPTSPVYLIKRSTAYQRSTPPNYAAAFADAEAAVLYAQKRAKRELIVQAQLRRGIALFGLERYADAAFVVGIVKRMDPNEKTLAIWENKIQSKMSGLAEDDTRAKTTVKETPEIDLAQVAQPAQTTSSNGSGAATSEGSVEGAKAVTQTPADKIRHEWYQNNENVYVTLFAKGVPKDKAVIDIQRGALSVSFPLVTSSSYDFSLEPLYAAVDPTSSSHKIMSTKVEVVLKKVQPGQKWHALEGTEPVGGADADSAPSTVPSQVLQASAKSTAGPSYPTSSRSGPKNWDKLANDLTTKKPKAANGDANATKTDDDDDMDFDKEEGDEVNGFFKKLYKGASPEVQRAMMKSFTESNGTALSTNWEEVSKAKVETLPPDGMEAKKWGQ